MFKIKYLYSSLRWGKHYYQLLEGLENWPKDIPLNQRREIGNTFESSVRFHEAVKEGATFEVKPEMISPIGQSYYSEQMTSNVQPVTFNNQNDAKQLAFNEKVADERRAWKAQRSINEGKDAAIRNTGLISYRLEIEKQVAAMGLTGARAAEMVASLMALRVDELKIERAAYQARVDANRSGGNRASTGIGLTNLFGTATSTEAPAQEKIVVDAAND